MSIDTRREAHNSRVAAPDVDDRIAIEKVRQGSVEFFEVLIRRYNQRLFRLTRSVLKNDADAEEAVQEAYIQAFLKLDQYNGTGEFASWLSRIALHKAYQYLRKNMNQRIEPEEYSQSLTNEVIPPDRLAHSSALRAFIERSIDSLPDEFRVVFVLRVVERLSIAETADLLDLPLNTVKTRQYRALKKLRIKLQQAHEQQLEDSFGFAGKRCIRLTQQTMLKIRALNAI